MAEAWKYDLINYRGKLIFTLIYLLSDLLFNLFACIHVWCIFMCVYMYVS